MSGRAPATDPRPAVVAAGLLFSLLSVAAIAASPTAPAPGAAPGARPGQAVASAPVAAPLEPLIARVFVNGVGRGDLPVLRDANGNFLVSATEFAKWGFSANGVQFAVIGGEPHVPLAAVSGLSTRFDARTVTLHLQVAAAELPGTTIDLSPKRRAGVAYPADASIFLNYGFDAVGDDSFGEWRYQAATELGARLGSWLFYSTTDYQRGEGASHHFTRLLTNLQYGDRPNLRRLTLGDFFTTGFDLSSSVPMGGVSFTKDYSMDPYFVQYPTAAFKTEVALPSTVQVRIDGNVVDQRRVPPGPLDINNITGLTGAQNVSVVIRDPFGREQVLQQPFFFATNVGLAEGLHEYSYNLGVLRRGYGIESNDYEGLALAAFHRYAFTDQFTLGLRGQAAEALYNIGPFGTYQSPRFGVIAGGVSLGGGNGSRGHAASIGYSYTGGDYSFNAGARYFSRDFAQLSDVTLSFHQRGSQYLSASVYRPAAGTFTATYSAAEAYDGPTSRSVNLSYTLGTLGGRGLLAASYRRAIEPSPSYLALLSFRYYLDRLTSVVAALGAGRDRNTQSLSLQQSIPQGPGVGYDITAGRAGGGGSSGSFGRGLVQFNAAHAEFGAEYARSSGAEGGPGLSRAFIAGSIGAVGGSVFASRPVQDSFALVRLPGLAGVPIYANGWFAGKTNAAGEVVANNLSSYYDNFITFAARDLSLDYAFASTQTVVSPPYRSGTLVAFEVQRMHAVFGVLAERRNGTLAPLEFRELTLSRGAEVIRGFTARRGEFYLEGVQPGEYVLSLTGASPCMARIRVPDDAGALTDLGTAICVPSAR